MKTTRKITKLIVPPEVEFPELKELEKRRTEIQAEFQDQDGILKSQETKLSKQNLDLGKLNQEKTVLSVKRRDLRERTRLEITKTLEAGNLFMENNKDKIEPLLLKNNILTHMSDMYSQTTTDAYAISGELPSFGHSRVHDKLITSLRLLLQGDGHLLDLPHLPNEIYQVLIDKFYPPRVVMVSYVYHDGIYVGNELVGEKESVDAHSRPPAPFCESIGKGMEGRVKTQQFRLDYPNFFKELASGQVHVKVLAECVLFDYKVSQTVRVLN